MMTQPVIKTDWEDADGLPRRSILPDNGMDYDPSEGIPVDVYDEVMSLYLDATPKFRHDLIKALHAQGLIEADDFKSNRAIKLFQSALMRVLKHDAFSAIQKITETEK